MTAKHPKTGHFDVRLRAVGDADLPVFFEHQRDPVAARMAAATPATRLEHAELWRALQADPTAEARTIVVDDAVVGAITCWERWDQRQLGYWLGRDHWGRGIATTALALFLCEMTTRPVHAYVAPHNAGSRRVLEKCGFRVDDVEGDGSLVGYVLDL
ncbi:GNAT family N-acetyltransferase [Catenulispora yoronensis]|uniref:GNAT family N-acetyltransferase n=1 Tax=Catenulispora yoronensis TaxID=450799 RepID=A0ABP5GKS7_9ACTN